MMMQLDEIARHRLAGAWALVEHVKDNNDFSHDLAERLQVITLGLSRVQRLREIKQAEEEWKAALAGAAAQDGGVE
jgi:hypothetical protein